VPLLAADRGDAQPRHGTACPPEAVPNDVESGISGRQAVALQTPTALDAGVRIPRLTTSWEPPKTRLDCAARGVMVAPPNPFASCHDLNHENFAVFSRLLFVVACLLLPILWGGLVNRVYNAWSHRADPKSEDDAFFPDYQI